VDALAETYYEVSHYYETEDFVDHDTYLGLNSTEEKARTALERNRKLPQFKDYPNDMWHDGEELHDNGFLFGRVSLDEIHWSDGFFNPAEDQGEA